MNDSSLARTLSLADVAKMDKPRKEVRTSRAVLNEQHNMMRAQDETLDAISETMERLKEMGYKILSIIFARNRLFV